MSIYYCSKFNIILETDKTENKKYSFEYPLLACIQNLAALANSEHFPVLITTIVQLI